MFCVNRNGWFHFRHRVPHGLTEVVGSTHIQCPLKTRKKRVANKLALELRDRAAIGLYLSYAERFLGSSFLTISANSVQSLFEKSCSLSFKMKFSPLISLSSTLSPSVSTT